MGELHKAIATLDRIDSTYAGNLEQAPLKVIDLYLKARGDYQDYLIRRANTGEQAAQLALNLMGYLEYLDFVESEDAEALVVAFNLNTDVQLTDSK